MKICRGCLKDKNKLTKYGYCSGCGDRIRKASGRDLIRERIRLRDQDTCLLCGKKWKKGERKLDVHHLDCVKEKTRQYDSLEKEQNNMITLCHKCHLNLPEHRKTMRENWKKH